MGLLDYQNQIGGQVVRAVLGSLHVEGISQNKTLPDYIFSLCVGSNVSVGSAGLYDLFSKL